MKKLLLTLLAALALALPSCNKQIIDLNYKFTKVHVFATQRCYEINSWTDYEDGDQIQVEIKDFGKCLFHANQIVLIEKECPFCDQKIYL